MSDYAADDGPSAKAWLALGEAERIAAGDEPVVTAYDRLRSGGVARHDAVHALASVVTAQLFDILAERREHRPQDDAAFAELDPADRR